MPSYEPVRFAILSPARWGKLLLEAAQNSDKLQFAGVYSRQEEKRAETTATFGGKSYESYEELLADPEVEAVLLPTPNFLHYPQTMAAFNAGKHVFVEKPIANSVDEAKAMKAMSEEKGLVLAVGMQGRRTGAARTVKRMIDNGDLGELAIVVAIHGAPILDGREEGDWYVSDETAPGGPLDQLGVHYADLMQYLFGPVRRVTGFVSRNVTPFSVPDAATVNFEFASGLIGVYNTQQVSAYVSKLMIFGTQGAIHFNRFGQELLWQDVRPSAEAKKDGPMIRDLEFSGPHPFTTALQEELEDFADCIRLGGQPEVGVNEGISALQIMRAVLEANDSGKTVIIE